MNNRALTHRTWLIDTRSRLTAPRLSACVYNLTNQYLEYWGSSPK